MEAEEPRPFLEAEAVPFRHLVAAVADHPPWAAVAAGHRLLQHRTSSAEVRMHLEEVVVPRKHWAVVAEERQVHP